MKAFYLLPFFALSLFGAEVRVPLNVRDFGAVGDGKTYECQLKAGDAGLVSGLGLDIPAAPVISNRKRAPKLAGPSEKPFGEWNAYDIYAHGDFLEVFVNGVRQNRVEKLPVSAGGIGLQMEGFPIEFRNVWLQPFQMMAAADRNFAGRLLRSLILDADHGERVGGSLAIKGRSDRDAEVAGVCAAR